MLYLSLAQAMQQLDILLLDRLDRHQMDIGALRRLTDSQCITCIALATTYKGCDVLGGYQQYRMTHGLKRPSPVMSAGACFHGDDGGFKLGDG